MRLHGGVCYEGLPIGKAREHIWLTNNQIRNKVTYESNLRSRNRIRKENERGKEVSETSIQLLLLLQVQCDIDE